MSFQACFRYPPRSGASRRVYHLDLAHVDVIEALSPGSSVLEVGCGGGQMRSYVQGLGLRYVGIDISLTRVTSDLREHGGPDALADAHSLPFLDASFDLVYSVTVTEHLADPFTAVREIARVLKPAGFYLGNVSFLEPWHDNSYFHMTPLGAHRLLTQADFDVSYIWPGCEYSGFYAIMALGNQLTHRLAFMGKGVDLLYRSWNRLRNFIKRPTPAIYDAARVAGATDWIARKRTHAPMAVL